MKAYLFLLLAHACVPAQVVVPADTNHLGTAFGGKLLGDMDKSAGIAVRRALYKSNVEGIKAVTVALNDVRFVNPAKVGDLLVVTSEVTDIGEKSITVLVRIAREEQGGAMTPVCHGTFTFVSVKDGKSIPHGLTK